MCRFAAQRCGLGGRCKRGFADMELSTEELAHERAEGLALRLWEPHYLVTGLEDLGQISWCPCASTWGQTFKLSLSYRLP